MRLGCDMSGRSTDLLARSRLDFKAGVVVLQAEEAWGPILLGDQTTKRAQTLAAALDRTLKLRTVSGKAKAFASAL